MNSSPSGPDIDKAEIPRLRDADALCGLGRGLEEQGRFDDAIPYYRAACQIAPANLEARMGLGIALQQSGALDAAAEAYRCAIALRPGYAAAHNNLAIVLYEGGRLAEAIASYRAALALRPELPQIHNNFAVALRDLGHFEEATSEFEAALALLPDYPEATIQLIHLRQLLCDWRFRAEDWTALRRLAGSSRILPPFILLGWPSSPQQQFEAARQWAATIPPPAGSRPSHRDRPADGKIRIGYLSGDLRSHAIGYLVSELFERHDRAAFDIFAYSFGADDGSAVRQRIAAATRFDDIRQLGHGEAARRIAADGIDILVDLQGFTKGARTQILGLRPAPIQVNFLGYPGTMAAECMDYVLADPVVLPFADQPWFSERIVHLPHCYQPNDTTRAIAVGTKDRAAHGLPETGFVFCSFNNSFKITPDIFEVWMRLLRRVPGSVLWLIDMGEAVAYRLGREAAARRVAPERLVFAPKLPQPQHLARHALADLFLDTFPYGAHTTGSDALWAGLPMLTCRGDSFASRVPASLLNAVGLPELVVESLADYEALAAALAASPQRLAALRARLALNRAAAPLFDMPRFARNIEAAYRRMHDIRLAGRPPESFAVT